MRISAIIPFCMLTGSFVGLLLGQETPGLEKNKVTISLVAVGDLPPIKYKATDRGPVFIDPPVEDFPPPILYVKNVTKPDGFDQLQLGLNTPISPIVHPGGKVMHIYENKADALIPEKNGISVKECYLKVSLADEKVNLTVFLMRSPGSGSWRTPPKSFVFKNDTLSFPPGSVRFINLSSNPVKALISGKVIGLDPSVDSPSFKIIPVTSKQQVLEYQIIGGLKGKAIPLAHTATSFYDGSRLNMVVYDSDGKFSASAMKLCMFEELPAQQLTQKPAAANAEGTTATRE